MSGELSLLTSAPHKTLEFLPPSQSTHIPLVSFFLSALGRVQMANCLCAVSVVVSANVSVPEMLAVLSMNDLVALTTHAYDGQLCVMIFCA